MTTNTNDGKNVQMVGRLSPFMEPGHVGWLHGMDSDGVMYREYKIPAPDMQQGDAFVRTLIDIRNHTINHVATVCRNKNECSGSFVTYVYTRNGLFVHRVPATEEMTNSVNRRIMAESLKARGDREIPRLDIDTDNIALDELLKHVDKTSPAYLTTLGSLTMKQGEYGPLDHHPGLVQETSERLRMEPQPGTVLADYVLKNGGRVYAVGGTAKRVVGALALMETFKSSGMTLDEATTISDITSVEEKVKAVEEWLRTHGGMDRINEATLSNALFGPAPGSRERALQADLEIAKTKCVEVVRPNRHGHDINFGRLAVSRISGIPFLCDVYALEQLGLPAMYISKIPPFEQEIQLHITFINAIGQDSHAVVYALEKEDLNPLGLLLSHDRRVAASFMAAHLKIWINGVVEREYTSPEEFFACDADVIERAKF